MICPQCKDDYGDEGHTRCVDCGIDLVPAPPEPEPEHFKFEEVLTTNNMAGVWSCNATCSTSKLGEKIWQDAFCRPQRIKGK